MTIKQHTCFTVHCDECNDAYGNGDGVTLHYDSAAEALSEAEGYDWVELPNGRLACDSCIYRMEKAGTIVACEDDAHDHPFCLAEQLEDGAQ